MRLAILVVCLSLVSGCAFWRASPAGEPSPESEASRAVADEGEVCGGAAAIPCAEGLACFLDDGVCARTTDATGTCRIKPEICTREYMPVCGCDGKTHGNRCDAHASGVSIDHAGECKTK